MFLGSRSTFEDLYRELLATKEAKAEVDRSRDETVSRNRELELKYQDLLLELKQLSVVDNNKVAELECQLKVKTYELDRCAVMLGELEAKHKHQASQNESLSKKIEALKDELSAVRTHSEKTVCALKLQIQEKTARLNNYERLETQMDKIITRAAQQSDCNEAEKILAICETEAFIPLNSKHRLQQSLNLARRILELENQCAELKEDLFRERDLKQELQRELTATKSCLNNTGRPTSELIDIILKRNKEIQRLQSKVQTLENELLQLKQTELALRQELSKLSDHEREFGVIKKMITDLRPVQESHESSLDHKKHPQKFPKFKPDPGGSSLQISKPKLIHIKKPLSLTKVNQKSLERKYKSLVSD